MAVPVVSSVPWIGAVLVGYGLANGIISPMQKSLLTQNAPIELRGGVVSLDRLSQQIAKTSAVTVIGLLLAITQIANLFWLLGIIALTSVVLMANLVWRSTPELSPPMA
jgi:sugar phosphate permease